MAVSDDAKVTKLVERARIELVELPNLRDCLRHAIKHDQWFVVCCMCSLIGELSFVALDPIRKVDKFPKLADLRISAYKSKGRHQERKQRRNALYYFPAALRHTCFHPAMADPIQDLPHDIFSKMSSLHTQEAADWALEQLDEALKFELEH
jgi:hypothetical protein